MHKQQLPVQIAMVDGAFSKCHKLIDNLFLFCWSLHDVTLCGLHTVECTPWNTHRGYSRISASRLTIQVCTVLLTGFCLA